MKDSDIKKILAEIEQEFRALIKSEGEAPAQELAKAEDSDDKSKEGSKSPSLEDAAEASVPASDGEAAPDVEASPAATPSVADAGTQEVSEEAPAEDLGDEMEAAPEGYDESTEDEIHGTDDFDSLKAEYAGLDEEALRMHYLAAREALFDAMGGEEGGEGEEMAEEAPAEEEEPAMKAEESASESTSTASSGSMEKSSPSYGASTKSASLSKSEAAPEADRVKELEGKVEILLKAVDLALAQPLRKAVTSVADLPENKDSKPAQELSKPEIFERLKEKSARADLQKSDRELINGYCVGRISVDKVAHLLK